MFRKIDLKMVLALILCVVVAAPVVGLIVSGVVYQRQHHQFTHALSVATVYADENDCMKAVTESETVRVGHFNTYTLFALFTEEQFKPRSDAPGEAPDLTLEYGSGATMECWSAALEDTAARKNGVILRFTAPDGTTWLYDTDAFNIQSLLRPAALSENEPWE